VPGRHTPVACALLVAALATAPVVLAQAPSGTRKAAPPPKAGPSKAAASPAAFDALVKDAAAAREAGRLDDAIALYRKAVRQKPDWIEGHWYIGTTLYERGQYDGALAAFTAVVGAQPMNGPGWALKGLSEFQLKSYDAAVFDLLRAREIGFGENKDLAPVVRYHVALLLIRGEQFEYALQLLTEFAVEGNEGPKVIEAMGMAALRMPLLPEAVPESRREQVLLAGRGAYYLSGQVMQPAKAAFEELVAKYPDAPNVHYAYGVYLLREDPDLAIEEFKTELKRAPGHLFAHLQIAFEYIKRSDWASARPWSEKAVALGPSDFTARQAFGQVLLELGETAKAIEQLEAGVRLAPDAPSLHFTLARAYQKAGRPLDAQKERAEFNNLQRRARLSQHGSQSVGGSDVAKPPQ
jgi:tetratricopeptide (TPR) repeat protein